LMIVRRQKAELDENFTKLHEFSLPEEGFKLIFKYKKRLYFMSHMTEVLDVIEKSRPGGPDNKSWNEESEVLKLVETLEIKNDTSELTVKSLVNPRDKTVYTSSFEKFDNKMERHLVVVNAVSEHFPEYKISSLEQLNDAMKFDSRVRKFVLEIRELLKEVSSMKPIMFEVEMPYELFKQYASESRELKNFNKQNSDLVETASKVFKQIVKFETENRKRHLSSQSRVLQVANFTADDLPHHVHVNIISSGISGSVKDKAYSDAVKYYKLIELHKLAGTTPKVRKNIFFTDPDDTHGPSSSNTNSGNGQILPSVKQLSDQDDEE